MRFSIEFYETEAGSCPVRDFLDELENSNPDDHASVLAGLARLRDRGNHRPPLSKPLAAGLFELRHVGKLNTRIVWFFAVGRRIVVVHAIRNKMTWELSGGNAPQTLTAHVSSKPYSHVDETD